MAFGTGRIAMAFFISVGVLLQSPAAQGMDLAFGNDPNALPSSEPPGFGEVDLQRFKAGDAVWGVVLPAPDLPDVSRFISLVDKAPVIRVSVWLYNKHQEWDELFETAIPVTREQMQKASFAFPIIPDKYDLAAPGLRKLLLRMSEHGSTPMTFKVRVEGEERFGGIFVQDGFVLELSPARGRHADWVAQYTAQAAAEENAREKPLIEARSRWIRGFVSQREDREFTKDVQNWWNGTGKVVNPILRIFNCSRDYEPVRNDYGVVLRKQACAVFVFKRGEDSRCFVRWDQFGYQSLGGGTFSDEVTTRQESYLFGYLDIPGDRLLAGRDYAVECSAVSGNRK